MTNIAHIDKSRGFTRMDNSIMEALSAVDLPARELRVVMAIARQTIGYQVETKRLTADDLGKLTNMRRDVISKSISHLLERRVIYRVGGSRGDIGISPVSEWVFFEEKQKSLTETKTSHSDNIVSLRQESSETKTATCLLYTKKEKPPITLPSEEIIPPQAEQASKVERKTVFGLKQILADNPHLIPEQILVDWLSLRKAKKAAVTLTVWTQLNAELSKCTALGITALDAMTEALSAGWQGFKAEWIAKRLNDQPKPQAINLSRHVGFSERDYTEGLVRNEDGSYDF